MLWKGVWRELEVWLGRVRSLMKEWVFLMSLILVICLFNYTSFIP